MRRLRGKAPCRGGSISEALEGQLFRELAESAGGSPPQILRDFAKSTGVSWGSPVVVPGLRRIPQGQCWGSLGALRGVLLGSLGALLGRLAGWGVSSAR
eukprot:9480782-Pyramimonas_sp.AAC.1